MNYHYLQAINPSKNIFRWYEVRVAQDLWGKWSLMIGYGRMGGKGRTLHHSFSSFDTMKESLQKILKKRLHAGRRIGCDYVVIEKRLDEYEPFFHDRVIA